MKKIRLHSSIFVYLFLLIISKQDSLQATDTASVKYFPLNVGDVYVYNYNDDGNHSIVRSKVVSDTVIFNKKYFKLNNFPYFPNGMLVRTDTATGSLYRFDSTNACSTYYNFERLIDSFSIATPYQHLCSSQYEFAGNTPLNLFEVSTMQKNFRRQTFNTSNKKYYAKYFGLYYYDYSISFMTINYHFDYTLKGCCINGVLYGDTSTTGTQVNQLSQILPGDFILFQNYPNPFNPNTIINYELRITGDVKLTVYDVNGKEVSTLVNQMQNAGSHKVKFDGSDLSSGIYFYCIAIHSDKLEAGEFSETKRMILLK